MKFSFGALVVFLGAFVTLSNMTTALSKDKCADQVYAGVNEMVQKTISNWAVPPISLPGIPPLLSGKALTIDLITFDKATKINETKLSVETSGVVPKVTFEFTGFNLEMIDFKFRTWLTIEKATNVFYPEHLIVDNMQVEATPSSPMGFGFFGPPPAIPINVDPSIRMALAAFWEKLGRMSKMTLDLSKMPDCN